MIEKICRDCEYGINKCSYWFCVLNREKTYAYSSCKEWKSYSRE